ncbi:hypothetical protein SAMN05428953_1291, partial [Mesorhizobium muleiense]
FELTRTFTPGHFHALVDLFSQNVSAKVSFEPNIPGGMKGSAGLCRPRFSFFNIQLSKNRHRRRGVVARTLVARGRSSVAHAALLNFAEGRSRSELLRRQRRAALVGEAYIVGAHPKCQQRFRSFLNFLRRKIAAPIFGSRLPRRHGDNKAEHRHGALLPPHCGLTPTPTKLAQHHWRGAL